MNWIDKAKAYLGVILVTPTGQLKFAMGTLWCQVAICLLIVISGAFAGRTDEHAWGFCLFSVCMGSSALYFMSEVLKFLKQSPESDADKSDDS